MCSNWDLFSNQSLTQMTEMMNLFGELVKIDVEKPVPASLPASPNACSICLIRPMLKMAASIGGTYSLAGFVPIFIR